jgi:hypothetical protein
LPFTAGYSVEELKVGENGKGSVSWGASEMDDIIDHLEKLATSEANNGVDGHQWRVRTIKEAVGEIVRLRELIKYSQIADQHRNLSVFSWFRRSRARVG